MGNFKKQKQNLMKTIDDLATFSEKLEDQNISKNIRLFKDEVKDNLTFNVLCLGDFSSGKSTFINQFFIGKSTLPTSVGVTTAKLTIIKYGEEEKIKLIYKDGSSEEISENFENSLNDFVAREGDKLDKIELVEVYIDSEFLKEGVVIVDSPGLNDPEIERMNVTFEYIKNADSILYLLTAIAAWKRSEKEFLEEKILRKEDLDKIFFLINYWDMIEEEKDKESVMNFVEDQMKQSLDIVSTDIGKKISQPPIIPISAKTKENFEELHKELWNYLGAKKGQDILDAKHRKLDAIKLMIKRLLEEKIELQQKEKVEISQNLDELKLEIEDYKKDVDQFRTRLEDEVSVAIDEWTYKLESYLQKIKDIIKTKISNNIGAVKNEEELTYLVRSTIQKSFYLESDKLNKLNKQLISKLEKIASKERSNLTLDKYYINHSILQIDQLNEIMKENITPEIRVNNKRTIMITAGSVVGALIAASIFPPLGLLGGLGLAYTVIDISNEEAKQILRQPEILDDKIEEAIARKRSELDESKETIIDDVLSTIKNDVVETYEEKQALYEQALSNKEKMQDDEIIKKYRKDIEELNSISF